MLGPEVDAFERAFAEATGAAHAVGVGTGTDAIDGLQRASTAGGAPDAITLRLAELLAAGGDPAAETAWEKRITQLQAKAKKLRARPGSYMFHLLQVPEKAGARQ